jgi:hypothetical protein
MIKKRKLFGFAVVITAIMIIAIVSIGVTSCAGPEGPIGPEGPQGPAGSSGADGSDGSDGQSGSDGRPATPVVVYTITFDSGEDGSEVDPQKVMKDDKAHLPENTFRPFTHEQIFAEGAGLYRTGAGSGWILTGWYLEDGSKYDFDKAVNADVHLKAQWATPGKISTGSDGIDAVPTDADFFDKALDYVIKEPSGYYLVIDDDYTADTTKTATAKGISLTIVGIGSERTITSATSNGTLFVINNGAQLYLDSNIILKGNVTNSTSPLISITNGSLTMQDGSKITGHTTSNAHGTIYLTSSSSRFVMNGGEISGNRTTDTTASAGIVFIELGGNFTMNNGTITGNTVGGGGCINLYAAQGERNGGNFTMNGGTITENTNTNTSLGYYPGGVYIQNCDISSGFSMTGGSITGNTGNMGDVFKKNRNINSNYDVVYLKGNAVIGTFTTTPNSIDTVVSYTYAPIKIGGNWTGSVEVLNLFFTSGTANFATLYTEYNGKVLVYQYDSHVLTSADIDNFKRVNFMRGDLQVQNIAGTAYVLVRSGADIGKIKN